jgi:two-component system KDP operon response regulator KdpE
MGAVSQTARIVVADSDRALLEMLQIRLDLAGYEAFPARSGPAALDLIRGVRPALVLLDLRLPELDGFGVLEEVLIQNKRLTFQAMAMARQLASSDIRRAAALGVRTCVAKPFSGADMLERVAKVLRAPVKPKDVVWI